MTFFKKNGKHLLHAFDTTERPKKTVIKSVSLKRHISLPLINYRNVFKNLKLPHLLSSLKEALWNTTSFILLLSLYFIGIIANKIGNLPFIAKYTVKARPKFASFYRKTNLRLNIHEKDSISRTDLIEISMRNLKAKRTRTMVTIGGMTIGIAAIVYLVSIGYGLQRLVINRVARLDEMKQAEVVAQTGSKLKINDKILSDFKNINNVKYALPLIALVGRVSYQNSISDMAVYGVTSDYLKQSAIKPSSGKIFDSNQLVSEVPQGVVAGAETSKTNIIVGDKINDVGFYINANSWIRVRENPDPKSKILGYTKRTEGQYQGEEIWGGAYDSEDNAGKDGTNENGEPLGRWIKSTVLLWKSENCDVQKGDCEEGKYKVVRDEDGVQLQKTGYMAEINLTVSPFEIKPSNVLGETTINSNTGSLSTVEIASEAGLIKPPEIKKVNLGIEAKKQAVVNKAMLNVLGIKENEALGKIFSTSFVVVGDLLDNETEKIESSLTDYTIIGITPDEKTPVFYVPFIDIRSLGITNYSQVKLVVNDQASLSKARKQIEAMGYMTRSVADTVAQIDSLFKTARTLLALLGLIALAVAALGMFNTLTVSLLERTREVGLMKALGMKSEEVQELFLTESMIMGFAGGVFGIIIGFIAGKITGVVLSLFAIFKGVGFIDISSLPLGFVVIIVVLSLVVGIATGIYPARRATKISALNALRYE
jgi:putative ABC transport system permease protein